jgi:hypothetical protein
MESIPRHGKKHGGAVLNLSIKNNDGLPVILVSRHRVSVPCFLQRFLAGLQVD